MKISQHIVITVSSISENGNLVKEQHAHLSVTGIDTEKQGSQEVRVGCVADLPTNELEELKKVLTTTLDNVIADRRRKEVEDKKTGYTISNLQHYEDK